MKQTKELRRARGGELSERTGSSEAVSGKTRR